MRTLIGFALALVLGAAPARAEPADRWRAQIAEASQRFGIPERWIEQVMRAESGGRTHIAGRPTTSPKGAMGLMQVMPATWAMLTRRHGLGTDPYEPRANILAGAAYLRAMHDRFGYPGLFAAYNAGPGRYAAYLAGRSRLPAETRKYVALLAPRPAPQGTSTAPTAPVEAPPPLFAVRRGAAVPPPGQPAGPPQATFFIALSRP